MKLTDRKIYDISMPISSTMPVYKGKEEKRPVIKTESDFASSFIYESKLEMNLHTGTHIDCTLHMIPGGDTVDTFDISRLITDCRVLDLTEVNEKITVNELMNLNIKEDSFILLKTKNSLEELLEKDFIYLDKTGASYLVKQKIKGVGIDALGIERNQPEHETHLQLMNAGIQILEGLSLREIEAGEYLLIALPINIVGAEAAPVRAILIK